MFASEAAETSHRSGYDVMVGDRENIWLSVYFHVTNGFTIMLSRENIVDSFCLPRAVKGTLCTTLSSTEERVYQSKTTVGSKG